MANNRTIGDLIEWEVRKQQIPIARFAEMICCNIVTCNITRNLHIDEEHKNRELIKGSL